MADMPDFDSMSPEEVMAWMESLAKRQGANVEEFTTKADMQIAEIDPDSVVIDEPGYVPFGQEAPKASKPAAPPAEKPAAPPPPAPEPARQAAPPPAPEPPRQPTPEPASDLSGMAWLESLAADQGGDFPVMDLASLSAELEPTPPVPTAEPPVDPMAWLEQLSESSSEPPAPPQRAQQQPQQVDDPLAAGADPMAWLESLARRQGARDEELLTPADTPLPQLPRQPEPTPPAADPTAWLDSLASGQGFAEPDAEADEMSDEDIQRALSTGAEIPSDQMAAFLDRQLQRQLDGGEIPLPELEEYDPDAPPIPAELPDWLLEGMGQPPTGEPQRPTADLPALIDEIIEPPAIADMPDWLREDVGADAADDLDSIFAAEAPAPEAHVPEIDSNDPWVTAFQEEHNTEDLEAWYEQALNNPDRIAQVERLARGPSDLEDANLEPEDDLVEGQPLDMPAWMSADADETAWTETEPVAEMPDWLLPETEPAAADLPDWLREAEVDIEPSEIPDWLIDTIEMEETPVDSPPPTPAIIAAPPPAPAPVPQPAPPAPAPAAGVDIETILSSARSKAGAGDLSGSLADYERIIRANRSLDVVVNDLGGLIDRHKEEPALYRVLGDGLMRMGRLQAALDTYRKALNQL